MPILVPEVLTEAYYGRPKELVAIENDVAKIKKYIVRDFGFRKPTNINSTKECKNIEKAFKDAFKLGSVEIIFYGGMDVTSVDITTSNGPKKILMPTDPNMYSLPQVFLNFKTAALRQKFKSEDVKAKILINRAFIYYYDLTPQEIIAFILHELGHAFDHSLFRLYATVLPIAFKAYNVRKNAYELITLGIGTIISPLITKISTGLLKLGEKILSNIPAPVASVLSAFAVINTQLQSIGNAFNFLRGKLKHNFDTIKNLSLDPKSFFGYAGEKYADSFATAYGYGVELSSALRKYELGYSVGAGGFFNFRTVPVLGVVYDLGKTLWALPFTFADPHPSNAVRIYSQLKKLRRELADPSVPKELKDEISSQIDELEELCTAMTDIRSNTETNALFSTLMNKLAVDVFKGYGDPREVLELIWRHEV